MKTLKQVLATMFVLLIAGYLFTACGNEKEPPNFLFVLVDDQAPFDLQIYDPDSPLEAPNINALAKDGMVFESARHMGSWSGAVCSPSRHMIMSGRTLWNLPGNRRDLQNSSCPDSLELQTIGAVFNRAGYSTMRTCKKGNSYKAANQQFTIVHEAGKRGGTEESGSAWHAKHVPEGRPRGSIQIGANRD